MRIEMQKLLLCERKASARSRVGCVYVGAALLTLTLHILYVASLLRRNQLLYLQTCSATCWTRAWADVKRQESAGSDDDNGIPCKFTRGHITYSSVAT